MDFSESVKYCFNNFINPQGRASRSEFWWFVLFTFICNFVLGVLSIGSLSILFSIVVFLPSLMVTIRRHHDGNRSGWWTLLIFIPLIGLLVHIFWFVQPGTDGPNEYGDDPLKAY